ASAVHILGRLCEAARRPRAPGRARSPSRRDRGPVPGLLGALGSCGAFGTGRTPCKQRARDNGDFQV
ncbi:hypothetical protein BGZ68_001008, partial [Mortierella alpina]